MLLKRRECFRERVSLFLMVHFLHRLGDFQFQFTAVDSVWGSFQLLHECDALIGNKVIALFTRCRRHPVKAVNTMPRNLNLFFP